MWCPEGYVTLHDIFAIIDELVDMFADTLHVDYGPFFREVDEGDLAEELFEDFWQLHRIITSPSEMKILQAKVNGFHAWCIAKLLRNVKPRLASPDGRVIIPSQEVFAHISTISVANWDRHFSDPMLSQPILKAAFADSNFSFTDGFLAFEYPDGIMLDATDFSKENFSILGLAYATKLQENFAGWAICFRDADAPHEIDALMDLLGIDAKSFLGREKVEPESEDRMRNVYNCVLEAFPDGKGAANWDDVQRLTGYSRRHIGRALAKFDPTGTWASGGH